MTLLVSDIQAYASTNGLGGNITGSVIISGDVHNVFDKILGAESVTGATNYRCFYYKNTSELDTLFLPELLLTPTGTHEVIYTMGKGVQGTAVEQAITDEYTAPSGIVFTTDAISVENLLPEEHLAVWLKREVIPNALQTGIFSPAVTLRGDVI